MSITKKLDVLDGINSRGDVDIDGTLTVSNNTVLTTVNCSSIVAFGAISANEFIGDGTNLTGVVADDANTFGGLSVGSFLRSDANDAFTANTLTISANTVIGCSGIFNSFNLIRNWNNVPFKFGSVDNPGVTFVFDSGSNSLQIRGATSALPGSNVSFANATLFVDTSNLRIGVGKNNPAHKLDVNGTISANQVMSDGSNVITVALTGPLSGLNADLVDGIEGYNLMPKRATIVTTASTTGTTSVGSYIGDVDNSGTIYVAPVSLGQTRTFELGTLVPVGEQYAFIRNGSGTVTFSAGAGATIISKEGSTPIIANDKSMATAIHISSGTWLIVGDLAP